MALSRILLPTDGSEGAKHAARFAGELAAATGATLVVLHITPGLSATAMGLTSKSREEVQETLRNDAAPYFEAVAESMGALEKPIHIEEQVGLDVFHEEHVFRDGNRPEHTGKGGIDQEYVVLETDLDLVQAGGHRVNPHEFFESDGHV